MKLLEYNVKKIFDQFAIPTMPGCVVDDTGTIEETLAKSGVSYPVVVKAQVPIDVYKRQGCYPSNRRYCRRGKTSALFYGIGGIFE